MVRFSKFTLNLKIYKGFEGFLSKVVWREICIVDEELTEFDSSYETIQSLLLALLFFFFNPNSFYLSFQNLMEPQPFQPQSSISHLLLTTHHYGTILESSFLSSHLISQNYSICCAKPNDILLHQNPTLFILAQHLTLHFTSHLLF